MVQFDHIEVHVRDVAAYGEFLVRLFRGGRWKQIGADGTGMFISPDGLRIEMKQAGADVAYHGIGFCLPCIRLERARAHIEALGLAITRSAQNPDGPVHFFRDPEGIEWHAKDYAELDAYVNW